MPFDRCFHSFCFVCKSKLYSAACGTLRLYRLFSAVAEPFDWRTAAHALRDIYTWIFHIYKCVDLIV